ncbi:YihY/virulence factor BrkB family protein [Frankia sp. AiPa1]|uniref:YihY/virulence factor BrkB family protein n=1 Tax=Frankia sp. AiPa1 TaxID=573492 RepID=UPI00202AE26A|nr:YihY/virulence factor BrkB family protein [Frankia sp. AiPa1]MCL9760534.1 YihY/virulence factor BrkB family protein [Frankia sp. AiPa1]
MAATWRPRRRENGSTAVSGSGAGPASPEQAAPSPGQEMPAADALPRRPSELRFRSWFAVLRRTVREFRHDELPDRAAALTYYGVLAVFPALLVLVSLVGLVGDAEADRILTNVQQLAPGSARDVVRDAITNLRASRGTGSVLAIVGLAGSLWSASTYIAAFIRAANVVYDVPEGRPMWKVVPLRIAVTIALLLLIGASVAIVVFSGGAAERIGKILNVDVGSLHAWSYAKWPVLAALMLITIALLYWSTPNVRVPGFRWLTPGSILAVVIWLAASAGFAVYVANFGSYNKTYGTLAGVIIFLVWLWLSNLAILLGLEFDAEIARERALLGGLPTDVEPYAEPRDTRAWKRRRPRPTAHSPVPRRDAESEPV